MKIAVESVVCAGEELVLTNRRAVFRERERMLICSDVHIGKAAHFRKHGIAVPTGVMVGDLERLEFLLEFFKAETLLVAGDLFHASANREIDYFEGWRKRHRGVKFILVKGNHDRLPMTLYERLEIEVHRVLERPPFTFLHDGVCGDVREFCISGHTHPGVLLKGKGRQKIKLPCYRLTEHGLVLPAFSLFTGLTTEAAAGVCYAFTETGIFKVGEKAR